MTHVARALELDESRGFMKALVDRASGQILGAAVLGIEGGELMAVAAARDDGAICGMISFVTRSSPIRRWRNR